MIRCYFNPLWRTNMWCSMFPILVLLQRGGGSHKTAIIGFGFRGRPGRINRIEGLMLLLVYIVYTIYMARLTLKA